MDNKTPFKNKLILLLILSIAAGFIFLVPTNNKPYKTTDNLSTNKHNDEINKIDCSDSLDITALDNNQKIQAASDSCLFIGCSGISF